MNRFKESLLSGKFTITYELIPGRGSSGKEVDPIVEMAHQFKEEIGDVVSSVSITDNPGGNPALSPILLGKEFKDANIEPIIHFTCKDKSRNEIEALAYAMERNGLENILTMSGDYPMSGFLGRSKPVYDLDSVMLVHLLNKMNRGLVDERGDALPPTNFFIGCVVSPFKNTEAEQMGQYFKLEKKIAMGAQYVVSQLGFDVKKFYELLQYLRFRDINIPVIGYVFVLSRFVAKMMRKGEIPGCFVPDKLMQTIEEEAKEQDKGKRARNERAAQQLAIFKGLGYNGVQIGGFGVTPADIKGIINRANEIGDNWQEYVENFSFPEEKCFYVFEEDKGLDINRSSLKLSAVAPKKSQSLLYHFMKVFDWIFFVEGTLRYKLFKAIAHILNKNKLIVKIITKLEKIGKQILCDCQECGDCALPDLNLLCPESKCAKYSRNGPCGGSNNGKCEAFPERDCVWVNIYERAKNENELEKLRSVFVPPRDWNLYATSSWLNFYMGKDHHSKKNLIS
ncbi:MAG: methylenetetrahydrofolate reductase C-terminal domain-containing protein [bacterium]|nr:methylenetetrahydrofolate reductase C-terminal domain-containing protein [bacterium]